MKKYLLLSILFVIYLNTKAQNRTIQIESVRSLYVELYKDKTPLSSGTGFIIKSKTRNYLITNYHVITGKSPRNGQWLDTNSAIAPNRIVILHNGLKLGEHIIKSEPIVNKQGQPLWIQYAIGNEFVDVVALPLSDTSGIKIYDVPYKSPLDTTVAIRPTSQIFILGFPLGVRSASEFPIWKSGTIASEPEIDQENKPIIWVDASTFPGMSGSPVYIIGSQLPTNDGGVAMFAGNTSIFLGVFSHSTPVFGALWKASFLKKLFDQLP